MSCLCHRWMYLVSLVCATTFIGLSTAAEPRFQHEVVRADNGLVAQNLLKLIHAGEVQEEISATGNHGETLEAHLRELDREWWPSRIQPVDKQREIIARLEQKLLEFVSRELGDKSLRRLQELELQSQGSRIMARPDVQRYLQLTSDQLQTLTEMFEATDTLAKTVDPIKPDQAKLQALQEARRDEVKKVAAMLNAQQSKQMKSLYGKAFDTASLQRIYPLAPQFIPTGHEHNAKVLDLKSLRGKVLLVHFYAFQCHNCVANFGHYKRWSESLQSKGVEVIGIQTPETREESDPAKVIQAATREGFKFPVLIDLQRKNWDAWGNTMWPTVYVIDKRGYIRYWWQGELNWQGATGDKTIEQQIDALLTESL